MHHDAARPSAATLARYLSGEANPAETAAVASWLAGDPRRRQLIDSLRDVWNRGQPPEFDADDALWNRIAARLERPLPMPELVRDRRPAKPFGMGWPHQRPITMTRGAAAAVLVLVGGAVAVAVRYAPDLFEAPQVATDAMQDVVTERRQRAVVRLADGSKVVLAPESRLRIPATFGAPGMRRDLHLKGEAYFEVEHDGTRPFRVHTAAGVAVDLGTVFVVSAYPKTLAMQVVVVSGAVAVHRDSSPVSPSVNLTRGDLARVDSAGALSVVRGVNLEPYLAWTSDRLVFNGTPIREVLAVLDRWYDLEIRLADTALEARRLTATFSNEGTSQLLELLARSLDVEVKREGRSVILSPAKP